ncbi:hypothetical protein KUV26_21295 [Leisingera daeponensis]|uniref:Uncharacterized protein n=1 Tax=Leisingera daeponensis TaxID=405746 RepID=A0ABS7NLC7_9RHOB|nr:hypothetical protein [Leisingera daeponensis]MBY6059135.1 hypothetical protein [Leisingera daeponensis]MBY6141977.1 hypothetical protein [Leisingera daeponensis]
MTDPADLRFFRALKEVCSTAEGVGRSCRDAIDRALETGDPLDMQTARKAVENLDDPLKSDLLRQVHLRMVSDLSAIWDFLPGAQGSDRPN